MMPKSATRREKPERSVNITAQRSPKRFQIFSSTRAWSAFGLRRSSMSFSSRSCDAVEATR